MENDTSVHGGSVHDFVKETVPAYSNFEFRQHFRMTRDCFEVYSFFFQNKSIITFCNHIGCFCIGLNEHVRWKLYHEV